MGVGGQWTLGSKCPGNKAVSPSRVCKGLVKLTHMVDSRDSFPAWLHHVHARGRGFSFPHTLASILLLLLVVLLILGILTGVR